MRYLLYLTSTLLATGCGRPAADTAASTGGSLPRWAGLVSTPDSVQLFVHVVGSGADTIIVLHGGPGLTQDYLAADLEPLAFRHTLIHYDQRGAGRSSLSVIPPS
jgi:proline iminopeptidase